MNPAPLKRSKHEELGGITRLNKMSFRNLELWKRGWVKARILSIGLVIVGLACLGSGKACAQTVKAQISWIEVTGKGYPPNKEISQARKRLLAKRAAVVDAYRLMAERLEETGSHITVGSGYRYVSSFIKGAEIKKVRYFHDGRVEVDLVMSVNF